MTDEILRSFGKFFGLAGLRLGFALGPAPLMEVLEIHLGSLLAEN
jgi:cobalamin biosynthetic protein CobC